MTAKAPEKHVAFEATTPSGIEIQYEAEPRRLYRVRQSERLDGVRRVDGTEWREVPSVTTVLEVLDKPALTYWGMRIGVQGVVKLCNLGYLNVLQQGGQNVLVRPGPTGYVAVGPDELVALLKTHKLTTNDVRDAGGDRGQSAHDAFEAWSKDTSLIPDPTMYPPEERDYVTALCMFLSHVPSAEPLASEVMVGSVEHGFAGRYDLRIRTHEPHQVAFHWTPKRGPQWATLLPGTYMVDLKTSKDVYPLSHFRQLEAYEGASIEDGYEPTDGRGILMVSPGWPDDDRKPDIPHYKFARSTARFEDFLAVLKVYESNARMTKKETA